MCEGGSNMGGKPRPQPDDWQLIALEEDQDQKRKKWKGKVEGLEIINRIIQKYKKLSINYQ